MLQKNPEHEPVRDQEERHDQRRNEVGGSQLSWRESSGVGLVKGVHEIDGAPDIEDPREENAGSTRRNRSDSRPSIAATMSPNAADAANAHGRSEDTTPGTKNANPRKRKLWRTRRGRNASARGRSRSSGQTYWAKTVPQAMQLNAMLPKRRVVPTRSSPFRIPIDEV